MELEQIEDKVSLITTVRNPETGLTIRHTEKATLCLNDGFESTVKCASTSVLSKTERCKQSSGLKLFKTLKQDKDSEEEAKKKVAKSEKLHFLISKTKNLEELSNVSTIHCKAELDVTKKKNLANMFKTSDEQDPKVPRSYKSNLGAEKGQTVKQDGKISESRGKVDKPSVVKKPLPKSFESKLEEVDKRERDNIRKTAKLFFKSNENYKHPAKRIVREILRTVMRKVEAKDDKFSSDQHISKEKTEDAQMKQVKKITLEKKKLDPLALNTRAFISQMNNVRENGKNTKNLKVFRRKKSRATHICKENGIQLCCQQPTLMAQASRKKKGKCRIKVVPTGDVTILDLPQPKVRVETSKQYPTMVQRYKTQQKKRKRPAEDDFADFLNKEKSFEVGVSIVDQGPMWSSYQMIQPTIRPVGPTAAPVGIFSSSH